MNQAFGTLINFTFPKGYQADVTYEGEAKVSSYQPQPAASSYAPVRVPAPKSYTPVVVTEAPYQQAAPVIVSNPSPISYSEPAPAPAPVVQNYQPVQNAQSFEPAPIQSFEQEPFAQASSVEESNAQPGEVKQIQLFFNVGPPSYIDGSRAVVV